MSNFVSRSSVDVDPSHEAADERLLFWPDHQNSSGLLKMTWERDCAIHDSYGLSVLVLQGAHTSKVA